LQLITVSASVSAADDYNNPADGIVNATDLIVSAASATVL
jgi:hypothetical protein